MPVRSHRSTSSSGARRWWALAALTLSVLVVALDGTIMTVALPTISRALHADGADLQWITGGYLLALSAALLPVGRLGDRFGHKRLLLAGMVLFALASGLGALARSPGELIAVRAVMGLGAAAIMPLSMAVLPKIFPAEQLPRAIAVWTAATALGMPVGPVLGGWLLNHFWWGSVLVVNLPVVGLALGAVAWLLPSDRADEAGSPSAPERAGGFDVAGAVLGALGVTAVVHGTILQPEQGWGSPTVLASLLGGVLLLVGFVGRERRAADPLVDLGLFTRRAFTAGSLLGVVVNFEVTGILFVVPQYLQGVLGQNALGTGLRVLPLIGGLLVAATLSEALTARAGARIVVPVGLGVLAAGAFLGASGQVTAGYGFVAAWLAVTGLGFGLAVVPATSLVLSSLPPRRAGAGTSLMETVQQVGSVLGVAALGSVLNAGYLSRLDVAGLPAPAADAARDSLPAAAAVADRLGDPALLASAQHAFGHGMSLVLVVCGVISVVAAVLAVTFLPRRDRRPDVGPPPDASQQAVGAQQAVDR